MLNHSLLFIDMNKVPKNVMSGFDDYWNIDKKVKVKENIVILFKFIKYQSRMFAVLAKYLLYI